MPVTLSPIPVSAEIVDKNGAITNFFRLRWQQLIDAFQSTNNVANIQTVGVNGSIPATGAYIAKVAGLYRVSYYMRKTQADGVSSSLQFSYGWTENAVPLTEAQPALTLDAVTAEQSGSKLMLSDALVNLSYTVGYASNTPGAMQYLISLVVEQLS